MTRLLIALLVAVAFVAGCKNKSDAGKDGLVPSSVDLARIAEVRALYQEVNANTRVGYINAVLPEDRLVSVTDVPAADFKAGDVITFVDLQQNPIATGRVVAVLDNAVHVRYEVADRAPEVGDIAVKFVR